MSSETINKVLNYSLVETTQHRLSEFGCQHVAVIDIRVQLVLLVGRIGHCKVITNFQCRISPQRNSRITNIKDVGIDSITATGHGFPRVITSNRNRELAGPHGNVLNASTGTGYIPVVGIGDMNVMITLTSPESLITTKQVFGLYVKLAQRKVRCVARCIFPIATLEISLHGKHGVYIEGFIVLVVNFLPQLDLAICIIFVTQTTNFVFGIDLQITIVGNTDT